MSEFKFNQEQLLARDTRGRGILVAAAAGSGKTRVLTERLMGYVCDPEHPVNLDRFLVITYTRAAAAELKSRITSALSLQLEKQPGNKNLLRQLALSRKAHIQTIHGFCADVLREYGHTIGLSPDFKIVEDERAGMMKAAALAEVIESRYAAPDKYPGFMDLLAALYSNRRDDKLTKAALVAYEKMQSHAFPEAWAREQLNMLNAPKSDAAETPWGREIIAEALVSAEYWRALLKKYIDMLEDENLDPYDRIRTVYFDRLCLYYEAFDKVIGAEKNGRDVWNRIVECVAVESPKLNSVKKDGNVALGAEIKKALDDAKKELSELAKLFAAPSETLLAELAATTPAVQALTDIVRDFTLRFSEEKRRLGLLDYSDLEHMAVSILVSPDGTPTDKAVELSGHFAEILVDEYQDVSEVQNDIISAVSKNGGNLFMVGDVKQSIYSFRLAKPQIFTEKCRNFTQITPETDVPALKPEESVTVFMNRNYRSRLQVIEGINAVFELCMSDAVGDVDYTGGEELCFAADYFTGDVPVPELMLVDKKSYAPTGKKGNAIEAEVVAAKIKELVDQGTPPGSIAILMRSTNSLGDFYVSALKKQGLPVSADGGSGFFESDEILALTSLLSIIDNPHKDIDILSVLRYPAFGFTPDELAQLRKSDRKGNLHAALIAYAKISPKAEAFAELLGRLRTEASELPVSGLVWKVMNETDFIPVSCAMPGGDARRTNLLQYAAMAENFDASGSEGLHKFLVWLNNRRSGKKDISFGNSTGEGVKIMTIHSSKGLEFPVVFVVGLGNQFSRKDEQEPVYIHSELGFGIKLVDKERHTSCPTLCRTAIESRMKKDKISEELRVLYVALTRAKERLFMSALVSNTEEPLEKYQMLLSRPGSITGGRLNPYLAAEKECYLPWVLGAALYESMSGKKRLSLSCKKMAEKPEEQAEECESTPEKREDEGFDPELLEELSSRFSFRYPFEASVVMPSKLTATAVKDAFAVRDEDEPDESVALDFARPDRNYSFRIPALDGAEPPVSPAEIGTATHAILQYVDFEKTGSPEEVETEIRRILEKGCITPRQARAVSLPMLVRFFNSETGKRIKNAGDRVRRELRFSVLTPTEQLGLEPCPDPVLLQGVADCCIVDPDGLVIIDYKTDRVLTDEELEDKVRIYSTQLRVYAGALGRIFRLPVKECLLFFLNRGIEREVTL